MKREPGGRHTHTVGAAAAALARCAAGGQKPSSANTHRKPDPVLMRAVKLPIVFPSRRPAKPTCAAVSPCWLSSMPEDGARSPPGGAGGSCQYPSGSASEASLSLSSILSSCTLPGGSCSGSCRRGRPLPASRRRGAPDDQELAPAPSLARPSSPAAILFAAICLTYATRRALRPSKAARGLLTAASLLQLAVPARQPAKRASRNARHAMQDPRRISLPVII